MKIFSLGEKIRCKRKELNMTLKDLAGDRITAGQLSFVELGKSNPSPELLLYIASRLGVTGDYLLESEASQARRICEYDIKLTRAYIYDSKYEDSEILLDRCSEKAQEYKLIDILGKVQFYRGKIALKKKEYEKSMEYFLKANEYYLKGYDYKGVIETYLSLGETSYCSGAYNIALGYYKQSELLSRENSIGDEQLKAMINFYICLCYIEMGNMEQSDKHLSIVEEYLNIIGNKGDYAKNLMTISMAFNDVKDYEKALFYCNRASGLFKEMEDQENLHKMEMNIGIIYSNKGDVEKSDYYLESYEKLKHTTYDTDMALVYLKLAYNCIKQNNLDKAIYYIDNSLNLAAQDNNIDCQIECYTYLFKIDMQKKDYKNCEDTLTKRLNLLESVNRPDELAECYMDMSNFYYLLGEKERCSEFMEKSFKALSKNKHIAADLKSVI